MVVAAVISLLVAALVGGSGLWTMSRGSTGGDVNTAVQRLVAPTQLAAAVMLTGGGVMALAAPGRAGVLALILGGIGAVVTVAVGSWRGAHYAVRRQAAGGCGSGGGCAGCELVCRQSPG